MASENAHFAGIADDPLHSTFGINSPTNASVAAKFPSKSRRRSPDAYLLLKMGKAYFLRTYPEGGAYVPERFPPLRDVIATWSKDEILAEVGRMWVKSKPYATNNVRDTILISAASQRRFTPSDLHALLLPRNVPGEVAWEQRTRAVMSALTQTHQLDSNRAAIQDHAANGQQG